MLRLEIIANNAVESDIMEALHKEGDALSYSRISPVHGEGHSQPKKGDAVWPEENFILVIYCEEETARRYKKAVGELKKQFTTEGIRLFAVPCTEIDL
ncbi:MAG: hypothetical protein PQJ60_15095 [Spirochaetales bacterium]|nr:hypothetical protein [Spirochaetales bacterium]